MDGIATLLRNVKLLDKNTLALAHIIQEKLSADQIEEFGKAFDFALRAHAGQTRLNGEPFINHPLRVAITALDLLRKARKNVCVASDSATEFVGIFRNEMNALLAAVLHDVAEDTPYTIGDIQEAFGIDVATFVKLLTKKKPIADLTPLGKQAMLAEYFEIITGAPFEVRIIKIADRANNLECMDKWRVEKQQEYVDETLQYLAPVAVATSHHAADLLSCAVLDATARIAKALIPKVE